MLSKVKICDNCTMRYLGIRDFETHRKYLAHSFSAFGAVELDGLKNNEEHEELKKPKLDSPCPSCLGILQLNFEEIANKAVEQLKRDDYKLAQQSFSLFIQLPTQLLIRHQAMIHYLKSIEYF